VFNVADAAVVIGGILLVVIGVRSAPAEAVADPS
jgi:lipoprotein signal peptidase